MRWDEDHELVDDANENFEEVLSNAETVGPAATEATVPADIHAITQSGSVSNTDNIDPSHTLAAETEAATRSLDYTNNRDFVTSSGQTIAETNLLVKKLRGQD